MRTRIVLLGGQTIALGLMMAFLVVPASALFLHEYGADALPYAYLGVAVAGVAVSMAMSRAQRRLSLARLATSVLWLYLLVVLAAWLVLTTWDGLWVTFPLLVLFPLSIPIGFVLVGSQAGRLLDVREMKAHFPRVAAGFSVGFAIGGIAAAALVAPLDGPNHLLAVDAVAALVMVGFVLATARRFPDELRTVPKPVTPAPSAASATSRRTLLGNRLVRMIFGYQLLSAAVTQLLDFMVWERAAARYPDPSDLAQFQGVFGAIINVASVLFVVSLGGWLLTRFGIGLGLAANPLGVLVLLAATSIVGYVAGPVGFAFFALVCAQQVIDIALTDGTTRTSINATYQALLPDQRLRAQTMIEGAGVPIALGFVGLLLILHNALDLDVRAVGVFTLLLTVAWVALAVLGYKEYGVNLREVLSRRAWDPVALRIDDDASRSAVEHLLASDDPGDVHAALDALVDAGRPGVPEHVVTLLEDPDPRRRQLGIEVAGSASQLGSPSVLRAVHGLLRDEDRQVRTSAAAALVGAGVADRVEARGAWLAAIAEEDPETVRAAVRAAAGRPDRFFVPYLVGLASSTTPPMELLDALVAHADHLLPVVERLLEEPSVPRRTRELLLHALGESGTAPARDLLVAHLGDGDPAVVEAAARVLAAVGHRESPDGLILRQALVAEAGRANRSLQALALLDGRHGAEPLADALRDEVAGCGRRVEVLLGLFHDPRAIRSGISGLGAAADRDRSSALEMLEVTIGRSTAQIVLAIVDPAVDQGTRQRLLAGYAPVEPHGLPEWLRELVLDDADYWREPWLRACALHAVATLLPGDAAELAGRLNRHGDPVVAETAAWVVATAQQGAGTGIPAS